MATMTPAPVPPQLLEALLRMSPLDVLLFDDDLVCRYAVLGDDTLFGRTADQFLGRPVDEIFPPARGDLRAALELAAGGSDAAYDYPAYRYTYRSADGNEEASFCWAVRIEPVSLLDYRGREEFRGVLVTLADVLDLADEGDALRRERDALQREADRLRRQLAAARPAWPSDERPPAGLQPGPTVEAAPVGTNRLLAALPPDEERRLLPALERVTFAANDVLHEAGGPIDSVYFPVSCVVSLLVVADGGVAEAATVCREGVVGLPVFPGSARSFARAVCQVPGEALRMPAGEYRAALAEGGALAWLVQRYTGRLLEQVMQTAACNRLHRVEQRAARWLLQIRDCVGADRFPLTQEALAMMLSVQRPTVTQVAGMLRRAGAVEYQRGQITVANRDALEAAACPCYRIMRERLFDEPA